MNVPMNTSMRVGVLTSGGDCPGLNAGILEVVRVLSHAGATPVLIPDGYAGLQRADQILITPSELRQASLRGGSVLGSSRTNLGKDGALEQAIHGFRNLGLDALVAFGGDGSLRGVARLAEHGIIAAGIPKTIDADVGCTDATIGFDTAVQTGCLAIEHIDDTRRSHRSSFVVEVMGRRSGMLAAAIARAASVDGVVVPEVEWSLPGLIEQLSNPAGSVIVVAESAWPKDLGPRPLAANGKPRVGGIVDSLTEVLSEQVPRLRTATLGHLLRGGSPVASDRLLAKDLAACAAESVLSGSPCIAAVRSGRVQPLPAAEGFALRRFLSPEEIAALSGLVLSA